ncbi:MAG: hypothetical protein HC848_06395 [Limnobacter sp.]|nr:hypothetical protein [Limnobacter sp.]
MSMVCLKFHVQHNRLVVRHTQPHSKMQPLTVERHVDLSEAQTVGRILVREQFARLPEPKSVYAMEALKQLLGNGEVVYGAASLINAWFEENPRTRSAGVLCLSMSKRNCRHVLGLLASQYRHFGKSAWAGLFNALASGLGALGGVLAAQVWLFADLCKASVQERDNKSLTGNMAFALQGERANRTLPLLRVLRSAGQEALAAPDLLVVGRPKARLAQIRLVFQELLQHNRFRLVRPITLGAAIRAVPATWAAGRVLVRGVKAFGVQMPVRDWVGACYRMAWGHASAQWWLSQTRTPVTVVFAHTGLADCSLLELAMQKSGTQTVHLVHGVSDGLNFTGVSSLGLFKTGHDAQWHAQLGGYSHTAFFPARRTALQPMAAQEGGLLLATNYAHPMNLSFQAHGIRDEKAVLALVKEALPEYFRTENTAQWKPHPVLFNLEDTCKVELQAFAGSLGFRQVDKALGIEDAAKTRHWLFLPSLRWLSIC